MPGPGPRSPRPSASRRRWPRPAPSHSALFWVDAIGIRGLAETHLSAEDKAEYEADLKPYLEAFDTVIGTFTPGTDLDRGTVIIRVSDD